MDDSICFCVHEPLPRRNNRGQYIDRDLSSASKYGRVEFVLDNTDRPSLTPSESMWKINNRLKFFSEDRDFIFWAGGDVMALGMSYAFLSSLGLDCINYLSWERFRDTNGTRTGAGFYIPKRTPLRFNGNM